MDFKNIKEFIQLAKDEGVQELKYENDNTKFAVSFSAGGHQVQHTQIQSTPSLTSGPTASAKANPSNFHEIRSPFVGTFYIAAAPGEAPFAKVGDKVKKGQILCILEAMKIMNEIESDISGEIVEICMDNENLVEFDEVMFRIKV